MLLRTALLTTALVLTPVAAFADLVISGQDGKQVRAGDVIAIDTTDGLRTSFATGEIVHLRPSGNAPELRCYAEAADEPRARALCDACLARIAASA